MAIRQGQDTIDPAAALSEPGGGDSGIRRRTSDPQGQPVSTGLSATGFREPGFLSRAQRRIGKGLAPQQQRAPHGRSLRRQNAETNK